MSNLACLILEKVYSASETPTHHTCGVSKTNEKLTNGLKITTHQFKLFKIKKIQILSKFSKPTVKTTLPLF